MTRFARAKGSKSSNERLPNESTPWHIMKQQLEAALEREQNATDEPKAKTKTAKQLLNEHEDRYYAKSLGNVSADWAEFNAPNNKKSNIKNGKVEKNSKDQNKKLKKGLQKSVTEENVNEISKVIKDENFVKPSKSDNNLKEKKNNMSVETDSNTVNKKKVKVESIIEQPAKEINSNTKKEKSKDKNNETHTIPDCNQLKGKKQKRKEKRKMAKTESNEGEPNKQSENKPENSSDSNTIMSKRQKRNQKKQNQKNESQSEDAKAGPFNAEGNDWNSSVNFGSKKKFDNDKKFMDRDGPNNFRNRKSNFSIEEKNFYRFGNNVPRKFQKKTAKPRDDREHTRRKPDMNSIKVTINGMDVEIVKYDGFPVKKEDAERLIELRKQMVMKGIPKSEIDAAMKLERRKCEKVLARIRRQVCFHCRKAGHNLSDCPELGKEEAGTGICFKCGSTEHTHFECKVTKSDDYRYAKCFICREQGHIAKQCPDNPKGLYPDGGACKICGDVTHLKKDCPDLVKEKEETAITLDTIKDKNLESLDNENNTVKSQTKPSKKIVKF